MNVTGRSKTFTLTLTESECERLDGERWNMETYDGRLGPNSAHTIRYPVTHRLVELLLGHPDD